MVKKKPAPQTRTPQSFKLFVGLMVVLVGLVLFRGISSHGISRFPVHRAKQPQSAASATAQSTDQAKVLGQETKVNPPTQEVAASHAASIFSSGKYANLRLENFGKPDYIVAQDNGKGVFYLQPGGNVFSEGSFNFADGVVRGGLRVEGDATLVNNLSIGGDTFKVEPTKGQVTVKGDFQVDGNRTIRGTGSLTINPTGNLYLQSESFLIDENGNLVVANVNAPELEYSGDITLRAKADKTTAVTITNPNDNYLANLSVEGDIAVNGGKVTLASGETIDAESADTLKLTSDGNVAVVLGDSAGQKKLVVYDAIGSSQVFAVDSDGNVSATGGATISGNVSMSGTLTADNTQVANFTSTGITALGDSVSDTLSIPAGLSTNFVPATASTYNLGSASKPFANVYADNLVASSSDVSGTKQETFTLDTDNTGGNLTLEFGATNNEQLLWDATNSRFRFTDDLLVDDGLTVNGNAIFSALTPGSIPFIGTGGVLTQNNSQLFWDRNNNKLGIGTSAPDADVDIRKPGGGIQWVANSNGNTNLTNGATLGSYEFAGYFNGSVNDVARIRGFYTGDGTTRSGAIGFFTHNLGSTSEKLRITSTGNVGIGGTNPAAPLQVGGMISAVASADFGNGARGIQLVPAAFNATNIIRGWGNSGGIFKITSTSTGTANDVNYVSMDAGNGFIAFGTNSSGAAGSERMRIDSSGNIGIGTTSPGKKLSIVGGSAEIEGSSPHLEVQDTGASGKAWQLQSLSSGNFRITDASSSTNPFTIEAATVSNTLYLKSNGSVGIGTTNPGASLHISRSDDNPILRLERTTQPGYWDFRVSNGSYNSRDLRIVPNSDTSSISFENNAMNAAVLHMRPDTLRIGVNDTSPDFRTEIVGTSGGGYFGITNSADGDIFVVNSSGNIGVGTNAPSQLFTIGANKFMVDTNGRLALSGSTNTVGTFYLSFANAGALNTSSVGYGITGEAQNSGSGAMIGINVSGVSSFAGTVASLTGGQFGIRTLNSSLSVTTAKMIEALSPTITSGAVSTAYGLYINQQKMAGVTTGYGVYQADSGDKNYFAGNVGIGTTSPSSQLELGVGQIAVPLGSVSNPSYSFTGDLNTGIFSPAADNLILAAGGATTLQITSGAAYIRAGGAANGPTLSFIGDTDMGLWRANTDTLAISTAGNERMRIDSSGNVGIGTTSPNYKLSISQPVSASTYKAAISIEDTLTQADSSTGIDWRNTQYSWNQGRIAVIRNGANANFSMAFSTAVNGVLTEGLRLLSTGNVGIGTTTPALRLNVTATGSGGYPTTSGTNQTGIQRLEAIGTDNILDMGVAGASPWGSWLQSTNRYNLAIVYPLLLNPNGGNVGIGTTAPSVPLEVQRNISGTSENVLARFRLENTSNTAADKYLEIFSDNTEGAAIVGLNTYRQGGSASRFEIRNENTTALSITSSSFVGIGTISPGEKLEVNGGVRLNTVTAKPTCDSSHRGTFWSTQGSAGVKDNVEVCAKDAADAYAWRAIY